MVRSVQLSSWQGAYLVVGLDRALWKLRKALAFAQSKELDTAETEATVDDLEGCRDLCTKVVNGEYPRSLNLEDGTLAVLMAAMELSVRADEVALSEAAEQMLPPSILNALVERIKDKRETFNHPELSSIDYRSVLKSWGFELEIESPADSDRGDFFFVS